MSHSMPPPPPPSPDPGSLPGTYSPVAAVKYGWTAFTRNLLPFLVVTLVILFVGGGITSGTNLATSGSVFGGQEYDSTVGVGEVLAAQAVSLVVNFVVMVISWAFGVALMRGAIDVVDTGRTELGAMFTRINWGHALVAAILVSIATWVGFILCIVPGIIIAFLLWFTTPAIIDGESAMDALGESYRFTTGHVSEVVLLALVAIGLIVLGICTLGIGLIVVTPVLSLGMAYTWRVLQRRPVAVL